MAAAGLAGPASAQLARVPTVTRLVKLFRDLELQLLSGADPAPLLADDFELRPARQPGVPVPRAEWLAQPASLRGSGGTLEQMAAHDNGPSVTVSFLWRPEQGTPQFIVDTWVRDGEGWKLKVRYQARAD